MMMKLHQDGKRSACKKCSVNGKGVCVSYLLSHGKPPQKSEGETAENTYQLTVGFHQECGRSFAPCLASSWS